MDAPNHDETLKALLNAGTATRVEQVLDDTGIRLERSGLDPDQIYEFWHHLHADLDPTTLDGKSILVFHRLVGYARASIHARANR